jgi:hypothetical protein
MRAWVSFASAPLWAGVAARVRAGNDAVFFLRSGWSGRGCERQGSSACSIGSSRRSSSRGLARLLLVVVKTMFVLGYIGISVFTQGAIVVQYYRALRLFALSLLLSWQSRR